MKYGTFRYDTIEVENGLYKVRTGTLYSTSIQYSNI